MLSLVTSQLCGSGIGFAQPAVGREHRNSAARMCARDLAAAVNELRVPNSRCEEYRVLVHAENGHPVRIVAESGCGARATERTASAKGPPPGTTTSECSGERSSSADERARERVVDREQRAADLDDGVDHVLTGSASQCSRDARRRTPFPRRSRAVRRWR